MPLYEYVCEECNHQFQQQRKVTARQVATCPQCKGTARKTIGAVGIIFKGSGWHCTDYPKPEDKRTATEDKAPAAAAAKSD